ncbi:hypothetical protein [Streptomyces sp. NPDC012510]|uniref:hypothetical protein n=1 Tax=Streptomyces sp. NPDC012510 TaxID=3364838 RepID=UPI0036E98756
MRRGTFAGLTEDMVPGAGPGTMPVLPAVVARRAVMADAITKIIASASGSFAEPNAGIGSDKPHGDHPHHHPHTPNPFAELGVSNRDVTRSAPSEATDVVGRAGHQGFLRPGSDTDLLVLGSSPADAASAVTDIRAVYRAGHRAR